MYGMLHVKPNFLFVPVSFSSETVLAWNPFANLQKAAWHRSLSYSQCPPEAAVRPPGAAAPQRFLQPGEPAALRKDTAEGARPCSHFLPTQPVIGSQP